MERRPRHSPDQTRREILIAAEAQFHLQGYGGMSMRRLAEGLGMSAATIHKYYVNKQGLAEAVCGAILSRFFAHIQSRIVVEEGTQIAFERFAEAILEYHSGDRQLTPEIFELYVFAAQSDWLVFRKFRTQVVGLLRQILEEGVQRRDVRPTAVAQGEQVFDGFVSILHPFWSEIFPLMLTRGGINWRGCSFRLFAGDDTRRYHRTLTFRS
jgi:AcrR family transcriptional regulator